MNSGFIVDLTAYSEESLKLAAFILDDWEFSFSRKGNFIEVKIKGDSDQKAFRELLNEALNQQCRMDLIAKNSGVANMIVTKALLSALGQKEAR